MSYKIVRMYQGDTQGQTIRTGLTLAEAKRHCKNKETSSSTCTKPHLISLTEQFGPWFDSYSEED